MNPYLNFQRVSPEREARVREADALAGVRRRGAEYAEFLLLPAAGVRSQGSVVRGRNRPLRGFATLREVNTPSEMRLSRSDQVG